MKNTIYCKGCNQKSADKDGFEHGICGECFEKALLIIETMPDDQFNRFLMTTPPRVQMLVRGRMCDWKKVLPQWYVQFEADFIGAKNFHGVQ